MKKMKVKVKGEGEERTVKPTFTLDDVLEDVATRENQKVGEALKKEAAFQKKAERSFEAFNKWTESKGYTSLRNLFNAYSSVIQAMRAMGALKGNVDYPQSILMAAKNEFVEEAYRLTLEFFEEKGGAK